ncbi:two pore domain potassium channel family protein [Synechococcus sp. RSCCF101]|uniref:potassium channel family protein n=1 Tax=Synechococcus sp. RSCCF101 TaxID=2511069 RepID=UPI001245D8AA|nr:potassium channel family protein [Synechococcus sp. RSCCF101]QEY32691.1 two pore domain potassium channel family protein [Synechococcus sp. RSCCF101]
MPPAAQSTTLPTAHRLYGWLMLASLLTLIAFALPPPLDRIDKVGFTVVVLLQIQLLGGMSPRQSRNRSFRLLGWLSAVSLWLWLLTPVDLRGSGIPVLVIWILFQAYAYWRLITRLGQEPKVTASVLLGAISGYVLLGLTASLLMCVIESINPGSFSGLPASPLADPRPEATSLTVTQVNFVHLAYFAFVTMTTLGYGDVLPVTPVAQIAVILFSILGPVYLAVMLGLLIGRYLQQESDAVS